MTDRPILFSAPMVRALLDGRKTQTRRMIEPTKKDMAPGQILIFEGPRFGGTAYRFQPRFEIGDRLWVKETYRLNSYWDEFKAREADQSTDVHYQADIVGDLPFEAGKQRPSIFMPRWASRLTLTVTDVRVQRLQECGEEDAIAEGIEFRDGCWGIWEPDGTMKCGGSPDPIEAYRCLWLNINGAGSWEENPWIVAVSFTVDRRNIDAL